VNQSEMAGGRFDAKSTRADAVLGSITATGMPLPAEFTVGIAPDDSGK
jgi:hypothetical protein